MQSFILFVEWASTEKLKKMCSEMVKKKKDQKEQNVIFLISCISLNHCIYKLIKVRVRLDTLYL